MGSAVPKIATPSDEELRERRAQILARLGVSFDDLRARATQYALVGEEHEAWETCSQSRFCWERPAPDDAPALSLTAFNDAVRNFFSDIDRAVNGCFVSPDCKVTAEHPADPGRLRAVVDARVALVQSGADPKDKRAGLATLRVNYKLCTDAFSQWLAVEHSTFALRARIDRAPIIRSPRLSDQNLIRPRSDNPVVGSLGRPVKFHRCV